MRDERMVERCEQLESQRDDAATEADRLRAERDRYREALERIARDFEDDAPAPAAIARRALDKAEGSDGL